MRPTPRALPPPRAKRGTLSNGCPPPRPRVRASVLSLPDAARRGHLQPPGPGLPGPRHGADAGQPRVVVDGALVLLTAVGAQAHRVGDLRIPLQVPYAGGEHGARGGA